MNAFRGCLVFFSMPSTIEPHFDGSKFSVSDVVVPSSSDYSIGDLLAAGFKVAPVSTEILHDERECQKNRKQNGQQERIYQANYKRQEQSN